MWRYVGAPCAPLRLRLCSRFTRCAEVVAPYSIILRLSQSEWRMVDCYDHFPSSILHSQLKTPERTSFRGFALCFGFLILREHDIEQNRNKCCRYNTGTAKNQLNRLRRLVPKWSYWHPCRSRHPEQPTRWSDYAASSPPW